ncbi:MAG: putative dienelactone hydrolase [Rhodothermales bacterium]|jgi:predicted dienelactone hydrolase
MSILSKAICILLCLSAAAQDFSALGPHTVQRIEFPDMADPARKRPVPMRVHLPKAEAAVPLVLLSHGAGGNLDANFAQAQHLASHGYVVLVLEHVGSNTAVMKRGMRFGKNLKDMTRNADEVLGRPKDISFAIDQATLWSQSHEQLRGRIDLSRIGVMGHSYGAYTTLVVTGMRPALDWLTPTVAPGKGLGPDLRDTRIDCGVALSPQGPGEPFFLDASYASLKVPLLGISGSRDRQQGAEPSNRRRAFTLWPAGDKYLLWLANADHLAFSDPSGSGARVFPRRSRADAQPVARAATLLFFDAYLKQSPTAKAALTAKSLEPYLRGRVSSLELLKK